MKEPSLMSAYTDCTDHTAGQLAAVNTDRHRNQGKNNTHRIVSKLLGEVIIFSLSERFDGLLLHTHGEQGLDTHTEKNIYNVRYTLKY